MKKIIKCWEFFECNEKECPVYKLKEPRCWLIQGTHCRDEIQGNFVEKMEICLECEPYKANIDADSMRETLKVANEQFKDFRRKFEEHTQDLVMSHNELKEEMAARKQTEKALRESEVRFEQIVENAEEWIWEVNAQGLYTYASPVIEKILGHQPEEIVGKKYFYDLFHSEDREQLKNAAFEVFATKEPFREFISRNIHKNGEQIWLSTSGVPVLDNEGNLVGYRGVDTNITKRKHAEEKLRKSEERYRTILEVNPDPIVLYDVEGMVTYVNLAFEQKFGWSFYELAGKRIDFVPEENWPETKDAIAKMFSGKKIHSFETRRLTKERKILDVQISASLFQDRNGEREGSIVTLRDITARKQAEEKLMKGEERYRLLVQNLPAIVYKGYKDWSIEFFDEKIKLLTGYDANEFNSRRMKWIDIIVQEDIDTVKESFIQALKTDKSYVREYRIKSKSEDIRWLQERGQIKSDQKGEIEYVMGVFFDVTARKQLRDRVQRENAKLSAMISSMEEGVVFADANNTIVEVNNYLCNFVGKDKEDILGKKIEDFHSGEALQRVLAHISSFRTNPDSDSIAIQRSLGGAEVVFRIQPIYLEGRYDGVLLNVINVTDLVQARRQAEERTRELQETQKELINQAMEAGRAQLSAMVLHNIGNAITPIKVQVEELKSKELEQTCIYLEKCYLELNEHTRDLQQYVNVNPRGKEVFSFMGNLIEALKAYSMQNKNIIDKVDQTVSYISESLTLQQAYAAREQEIKERVDLNVLIEDAIYMQKGALEKRGIILKKDMDPNKPKLLIDRNRLMQVIVNLIMNSYEAIAELNDKEKVINIKTFSENGKVGVKITDSGIGIEPDKIDTIFEFGESHKGSSGFGLYYCRMFVKANKGVLMFSSPGKGKGAKVEILFEV